jgi:hypothetical protein
MIFGSRARVAAAAVAFAGALSAGAFMSSPASAAQVPKLTEHSRSLPGAPRSLPAAGRSVVITAHRVATGRQAAAMPASISCTISASAPLGVPQGAVFGPYEAAIAAVGGLAVTTCTSPVERIEETVSLYWQQILEQEGPTWTASQSSQGGGWVITGCVAGDWNTFGQVTVFWPPGYSTPFGQAQSLSPTHTFSDSNCDD